MGFWKRWFGLETFDSELAFKFERRIADFEIMHAMIKDGWQFAPSNASDQEQIEAHERFMASSDLSEIEWYPPGYIDESRVPAPEGDKLRVDPEPEERPFWKDFLGI